MTHHYVTSAHFRTPSGCPGIEPVLNVLQQNRRLPDPINKENPSGPPLSPSASTLQKMTRRFKPHE
ncbi:MAG: Uncharacterised protein [Opitutia bacterium UBA7350]|nr:MAG: Uncharacterised protein [Opitutae bacterium UBA7350]